MLHRLKFVEVVEIDDSNIVRYIWRILWPLLLLISLKPELTKEEGLVAGLIVRGVFYSPGHFLIANYCKQKED